MKSQKSTMRNSTRARSRNPRALLTSPQQIPGAIPTICPAGLTKPSAKANNPR
jgi:hypothetical protein